MSTLHPLGRIPTPHTIHLDKYPLTSATAPTKPSAMAIGTNWYENFDRPVKMKIRGRNRWVIGHGALGRNRGGHATTLRPWKVRDARGWWAYYNQQNSDRCVEFTCLRQRSLDNRKRYDITSKFHYFEMQKRDYWAGGEYPGASPVYGGTSIDAGMQVMKLYGAIPTRWPYKPVPLVEGPAHALPAEGISAYRWARDWDTVRSVLGVPDWLPGVPLLNSWGKNYPREVILLDEVGPRLIAEHGEFAIATDR